MYLNIIVLNVDMYMYQMYKEVHGYTDSSRFFSSWCWTNGYNPCGFCESNMSKSL